jgi:hypothetical protein
MRDPKRIKPFLEEVEKYWMQVPDWRFGQFIVNWFYNLHVDPFYLEDDEILKSLKEFFDKLKED